MNKGSIYINGFTRTKVMEVIKSKGLAERCGGEGMTGSCFYRNKIGNMCLIGRFIPDSEYTSEMEFKTIYTVLDTYSSLHKHMPLDSFQLSQLQSFHDHGELTETGDDFYKAIENRLIEMEGSYA